MGGDQTSVGTATFGLLVGLITKLKLNGHLKNSEVQEVFDYSILALEQLSEESPKPERRVGIDGAREILEAAFEAVMNPKPPR